MKGLLAQAQSATGQLLDTEAIRQTLGTLTGRFTQQKVLVLIPDHTRTLPLPQLFRMLVDILDDVKTLDFMVALGTHPPLDEAQMLKLVGISTEERHTTYRYVGLHNHAWQDPDALATVGVVPQARVMEIAGERWHPTLGGDVQVKLNRAAVEADQIIILGPTFPHEVVGFSGGAKYLFPGISGPEMINVTHWLGALATVRGTIGLKDTPVRALIHEAARHVPTSITLIALVVQGSGLAGYLWATTKAPGLPPPTYLASVISSGWTSPSSGYSPGPRPCTTNSGPQARPCTSSTPPWPMAAS